MKFKAVLSDAGDILLDSHRTLDIQKRCIAAIYNDRLKLNKSDDEVYTIFKPYKRLSQTTSSLEEAVNLFLSDNNVAATYQEYAQLFERKKSTMPKLALYTGVTEVMEKVNRQGIPFLIISDSTMTGEAVQKDTERMIIKQLRERNVYDPDKFHLNRYVTKCLSSRDIGVRKPDRLIFEKALEYLNLNDDWGKALFIAHEQEEIFGAAELGMTVAAVNCCKEKDAEIIHRKILAHQARYEKGLTPINIYHLTSLSEIPLLLRE